MTKKLKEYGIKFTHIAEDTCYVMASTPEEAEQKAKEEYESAFFILDLWDKPQIIISDAEEVE